MNPFSAEKFELNLRLRPREALNRIIHASDQERRSFSLSGFKGTNSFLHRFTGNTLAIQKRRYYRNDFHPYLYAQFELTPFGSKLTGHFSMSKYTRRFMLFWFGFIGFAIVAVAISALVKVAAGQSPNRELLNILFPIGMFGFGYLTVAMGEKSSRKEKQELVEWLERIFADSIDVPSRPSSIWRE